MARNIAFCETCRKKVEYLVEQNFVVKPFHGTDCECLEKNAVCPECKNHLWNAEFHDFNLNSLYEAYRKQNKILSLSQMGELLEKYNIKKRPFSIAAGLGEITFTNYLDGDLPSRANAEILYKIYHSPTYYKELLERNKNLITEIAYKKSLEAVNKLLVPELPYGTKIEQFASYLILNSGDITPLQLQKLLYYIQALFIIYYGRYAFTDDCEAWQHGPVFREIYEKYKDFRYESINQEEPNVSVLTGEEKQIADVVISVFGFYSGKVLEGFTHQELPWKQTREGLLPAQASSRIISKELLSSYFNDVKRQYNLISLSDIRTYASELAQKV